jgi:hypothetical protein
VREVIATEKGPKAIGPYSQAIKANGFIFISGQVAFDPATSKALEGDAALSKSQGHRRSRRFLARPRRQARCLSQRHERFRSHERGLRPLFPK